MTKHIHLSELEKQCEILKLLSEKKVLCQTQIQQQTHTEHTNAKQRIQQLINHGLIMQFTLKKRCYYRLSNGGLEVAKEYMDIKAKVTGE